MPFYLATYKTRIGESGIEQQRHVKAPDRKTGERWAELQALAMSTFSFGHEKITTCVGFELFPKMTKAIESAQRKSGFLIEEDPFTKEDMKLIKEDFEDWADRYPDWLVKEVMEA